jgi:hypothetical protein
VPTPCLRAIDITRGGPIRREDGWLQDVVIFSHPLPLIFGARKLLGHPKGVNRFWDGVTENQ